MPKTEKSPKKDFEKRLAVGMEKAAKRMRQDILDDIDWDESDDEDEYWKKQEDNIDWEAMYEDE